MFAILSEIAPLDFEHEVNHPHPHIRQVFFHLSRTSEFLIIDVCVQSNNRGAQLTTEHKDEVVKVLFDKKNVVQYSGLDQEKFRKSVQERVVELKKTLLFFQAWVKKGTERKNFLEALGYYHSFVLRPLVEILRIKYEPTKRVFYLKHIKRDLPEEAILQLEDFYKVNSVEEITKKTRRANVVFFDVVKDIEEKSL